MTLTRHPVRLYLLSLRILFRFNGVQIKSNDEFNMQKGIVR